MWLLMFWMLTLPTATETATFDIIYDGKVIGEMSATRERTGEQEIYRNTTTVRGRFIGEVEVQYQSKVVYKNGVLQESSVKSLVNGDVYSDVKTQKSGSDYQFLKNGKAKHTVKGPITYSALQMLFEEPLGKSAAYSEEAGNFNSIQSNGKASYDKVNSRGRTNRYFYENNFLKKIEIDAGIVEFEMVRKK
ncbi:MAG: DUF6134 family protein [Saprospiraceae bacterium]